MRTVLNISTIRESSYEEYTYKSRLIDKFKMRKYSNLEINEIDTVIKRVCIPANLNMDAYKLNLRRVLRKRSNKYDCLSLSGNRIFDIYLMNKFQLSMISYSIVESIKYILMNNHKSIRNSNILLDIEEKTLLSLIVDELAKESKNIIMLPTDFAISEKMRKYAMKNYGVAIEIVYREESENVDFVISSRSKEYVCKNVWYLNNFFRPKQNGFYVNDVLYRIPWNSKIKDMSPQLIATLVKSSNKRSVSQILEDNQITLQSIIYNGEEPILL